MEQRFYDNPFGQLTRMIDPEGRETRYVYDANGIDLLAIEANDNGTWRTLQSWDQYLNHQPQRTVAASGLETLTSYNSKGQPTLIETTKGANSEKLRFTYDADLDGSADPEGYLIKVERTDPQNDSGFLTLAEFTYDSAGRIRTTTDPDGYTLTYDYDNIDRVTLITHPDGTTEQYVYDRLDLHAVKDRDNLWNRTWHNPLRQPVVMQDPAGRIVQLEWCKCGDIQKIIDQLGHITRWVRDEQGRPTQKIYANGDTISYDYQPLSGQLASTTQPNDQGSGNPTVTYAYSLAGYLLESDYAATNTPDESYQYNDYLGRLTQRTDGIGTSNYAYHPIDGSTAGAGALATIDGPWADDTLRASYDWQDRPVTTELLDDTAIPGWQRTVSYDSLGRMAQEQNGIGTFTYEYPTGTASNRLVRIGKPFGQETLISYHPLGAPNAQALRLASIVNQATGGTPVHSQFGYGFDASGRLTQWDRLLGGQTSNYTLENNLASELTGATERDAASTILSRQSWHYDAAGNRLTTSTGSATDTFTYNDANQLVQEGGAGMTMIEGTINEPGQVEINGEAATMRSVPGTSDWLFQKEVAVTPGTNSFTVEATDENSNTAPLATYEFEVSSTTTTLTYDDNGNLLSDGTRTYTWDAKNRLLSVTESGVTYSWKYDGLDRRVEHSIDGVLTSRWIWAGTEMIEERDATGQLATQWYNNGELQNGTALVYNTDHLGSVRELIDGSGTVRARYDYSLWGARTKLDGDLDSRKGFTGHYTQSETGLVLAMYRAYDPEFSRWLSRDPIGESGGINLYGYVGNSPVDAVDVLGQNPLNAFLAKVGIDAAIGAGAGAISGAAGGFIFGCPEERGKAAMAGAVAGAVGGGIGGAIAGVSTDAIGAPSALGDFAGGYIGTHAAFAVGDKLDPCGSGEPPSEKRKDLRNTLAILTGIVAALPISDELDAFVVGTSAGMGTSFVDWAASTQE